MIHHRRGGYLDAMNMVLMIPTFILIAFGIGVLVYGLLNDNLDTAQFDDFYMDMYTSQLVNTPQCFAYQDPQTKRVDYGIIDEKKLTNQRLVECFTYGEPRRQLPIKLDITNFDTGKKQTFTTATWHEGINVKMTQGKEATMITTDMNEEHVLLKMSYGAARMMNK